ncbi:polyamine ABC transporter substrate-binding protein [Couchioplanes azureus]|uniref:polyamine ABC transporter substrate-binding protein n=1 Tax=Couchioplanes caeruleus TaxID=56438 RepID=UPI001670FEA8|nr:spermidine/putrescine ABC transporter substrate-binding protein [Couchioplanes caeruleus]GGQ75341.1 putrescine-binding periplasmic protein [Couchioplanes caeruleus subsp. azureus]
MSRPLSRRALLGASLAGLTGLATSACSFAADSQQNASSAAPEDTSPPVQPRIDGPLIYFNWADYVDPSVFEGFGKEYGVKVVQSHFDSMESMVAKINAGNAYDLIFPSAKWTQRLARGGKLRRIDHTTLRNAESVFGTYSYFADPWYDPQSAHSVPFSMYKTGIGWRKDKLGESLGGSWADLWNPKAKGYAYVLDDRDEVLGMAALKLGLDLNTSADDDLRRIVAELKGLRPNLRGFSSDDWNNLLSGNAHLTQAWSGDMVAVLNQAEDADRYGFEVAREGAPLNSDCYAIPANAAHPGTALLFIDYMLRPENVKKNITYIGYPMPVKGAEQIYAPLIESLPQCAVTPADLRQDMMYRNGTQEQERARDKAWTEAKAG